MPARAALPGLVIPRLPPARDGAARLARRADPTPVIWPQARSPLAARRPTEAAPACRRPDGSRARPGPAPAPPDEVGASAAGDRRRARDRDGRRRPAPEPTCWRGSWRGHSLVRRCRACGSTSSCSWARSSLRGLCGWGTEVAGRRAAWSVLSELRMALVEKRLRDTTHVGGWNRERRDRRGRGPGDRRVGGLLRALLAPSRCSPRWCRRW